MANITTDNLNAGMVLVESDVMVATPYLEDYLFNILTDLNAINDEIVAGAVSDGANVGTGAEVFQEKNGSILEFRTLVSADGSVVITQGADEIDLAASSLTDGTVANSLLTWDAVSGDWDEFKELAISFSGGLTTFLSEDSVGAQVTSLTIDGDADVALFFDGAEVMRTLAAASGGLEANNTLTGAGFERVLTTSDLLTFGNWKTFYTDGSGVLTELALGASTEVLTSNGPAAAPSWQAGGGGLTQFQDNGLFGEGLYDATVVFRTSAGGIDVADSSGDDPIISWYRDSTFATRTAYINTNNITSHMTFLSSQTSGHMLFYAADNTGVAGLVFEIDPDTSTDLYYDGSNVLRTQPQGIYIASSTSDADPFIGFYSTDAFSSRSGYIQFNNLNGLIIEQEVHGLPITLQSEDSGGTLRQLFVGDPDGDVELYNDGNLAFLTTSVGAGVQHPTSTTPRLDLRNNSSTRVASFEANTTITKIKSVIHGGNVNLTGENTAGTEQILFAGDPDGPAELYYDGSLVLSTQSGGILVQDDSGNVADIDFAGSTGTALGRLVATTTSFSFGASQNSASVSMTSLSSAAVSRFLFLGDPDGESQMYRTGTAVLGTASLGAFVRDSAGDNPLLRMESNAGVVAGWLYFGATGGYIRNYQNGTNWRFLMNDAGGTSQTIIDMDGDIGLGFNGQSAFAAPTYVANATAVLDRTLLASASATTTNNNNVLAALIADLQSYGLLV